MLEKDLTYFQVLGAISTVQSQMIATLVTDERNIVVKEEAETESDELSRLEQQAADEATT